ncbi:MAG: methyltransferase domain-containing protein [Acidobacteriota bacterium]|jgi:SAM-dependent methyltransferase|nr:methyltransferase domain-containing protein [Acidobacteriota bacterium]
MTNADGPGKILKLAQGFMESRILLSAAELDLFTVLQKAPLPVMEIASRVKGDPSALAALLDAVAALGLLQKKDGAYFCEPAVARYLAEDSPETVLPMVLHAASLWNRWARLTDIAQGAPAPTKRLNLARTGDELKSFIGAMHSIGAPLARQIAADVQPGAAKSLLDIGGGSGTYAIAFLREAPEMRATIFDMPAVIEMARARLEGEGLMGRATLVPGNFHRDELPVGHDLVLLSAIIHSNSPAQNLELYRKIFHALVPGGRLLIRDHVMEPDRIKPRDGAIFAINMLVGTLGGSTYTYEEIASSLGEAGFGGIRLLREGEHMDAVVEAFKPTES